LEDVDPYIMHKQITEYVHPLDFYGNIDYDAGNVCLLGTANLECSTSAKYGEQMYGSATRGAEGSDAGQQHAHASPTALFGRMGEQRVFGARSVGRRLTCLSPGSAIMCHSVRLGKQCLSRDVPS